MNENHLLKAHVDHWSLMTVSPALDGIFDKLIRRLASFEIEGSVFAEDLHRFLIHPAQITAWV
jgi:hypothetical protein